MPFGVLASMQCLLLRLTQANGTDSIFWGSLLWKCGLHWLAALHKELFKVARRGPERLGGLESFPDLVPCRTCHALTAVRRPLSCSAYGRSGHNPNALTKLVPPVRRGIADMLAV